ICCQSNTALLLVYHPPICRFSLPCSGHHRDLHSFPTRRSSDLCDGRKSLSNGGNSFHQWAKFRAPRASDSNSGTSANDHRKQTRNSHQPEMSQCQSCKAFLLINGSWQLWEQGSKQRLAVRQPEKQCHKQSNEPEQRIAQHLHTLTPPPADPENAACRKAGPACSPPAAPRIPARQTGRAHRVASSLLPVPHLLPVLRDARNPPHYVTKAGGHPVHYAQKTG